ncbi:MAG: hypothetical protein WA871_04830 [Candidatus Acidiferrales bacterium]
MRRVALLVFASVLVFSLGAAAQDLDVAIAPSTPAGAAATPPAFKSGTEYPLRVDISYQFTDFRNEHGLNYHDNGINTNLTGYLGHDFALEADVAAGFGTASFKATNGSPVKLNADSVFYGGGIRIGPERTHFQPFVHALIGGERLQFTQYSSTLGHNNGLGYQLGGGADLKIGPRAYWRIEADYLGTHIYSAAENNIQFDTGIAFSF